ncbi:unnamed protein product, partial [Polarella glacialis]
DSSAEACDPHLQDSGASCRVCQVPETGDDLDEALMQPCLCSGSVQWIHRSCLDRWRSTQQGVGLPRAESRAKGGRCELCGFAYLHELCRATRGQGLSTLLLQVVTIAAPLALISFLISVATSLSVGVVSGLAFLGLWAPVDAV